MTSEFFFYVSKLLTLLFLMTVLLYVITNSLTAVRADTISLEKKEEEQ